MVNPSPIGWLPFRAHPPASQRSVEVNNRVSIDTDTYNEFADSWVVKGGGFGGGRWISPIKKPKISNLLPLFRRFPWSTGQQFDGNQTGLQRPTPVGVPERGTKNRHRPTGWWFGGSLLSTLNYGGL
jgi:hypothetical protein